MGYINGNPQRIFPLIKGKIFTPTSVGGFLVGRLTIGEVLKIWAPHAERFSPSKGTPLLRRVQPPETHRGVNITNWKDATCY